MKVEKFKNLIIGSGEGANLLAWQLDQSGQRTAVVGNAKFVGYMTVDVQRRDGSVRTLTGERILLNLAAAELWSSIAGLRLELAGIELNEYGTVHVNDRLETTCPNVWAIGQQVGRPRLSHASLDYIRIIWAGANGNTREEPVRLGLEWSSEPTAVV